MSRHRWGPPVVVEVPWSAAGGNLYTCVKCGTTRQSVPDGHFFQTLFTSADGTIAGYNTPPCHPVVSPQKA